jgi:prophage maintenance system killer protein
MSDLAPWESLLTSQKVMELHARAMLEHSEAILQTGPLHEDCVEGKLGNAWQSESYVTDEDAKHGLCFAGFLLFYLTLGNCFPEGNKRIGWISATVVLASLGLTVKATDDEAEGFVTRIADGTTRNALEVIQWLAARVEAPD